MKKENNITSQIMSGSHEILEISFGQNDIAAYVEQINASVDKINELFAENRKQLGILLHEISRFKVD